MIKGLSPRAQKLLTVSTQNVAKKSGNTQLLPEHLLVAMILEGDSLGFEILKTLKVNILMFQIALEQSYATKEPIRPISDLPPSRRFRTLLDVAAVESRTLRKEYIGTEHFLLAAIREEPSAANKFLSSIPITLDQLRYATNVVYSKFTSSANPSSEMLNNALNIANPFLSAPQDSSGQFGMNFSKSAVASKQQQSLLAEFSRDLTAYARSGECDPVVGRDKEIQRVIQILCRRNKNNPVLVGEPGVGKTAIVEGIASRIVSENVPQDLINKRLLVLDLASVIAGTKYRGEFEERIKRIMKEVAEQKNIILFIDELHTIIGAGGAEGSMDASNMLKPALSRGELQCIGATTLSEYRKYFERDAALERRFQIVQVSEPDDVDTLKILNGIKEKYEIYHHVKYADGVIDAIVRFSRRYLTERFLPDKAIDLLDEAGALKKIEADIRPAELADLEKRIAILNEEKKLVVQNQNYERAAEVRDEVRILRIKAEELSKNCRTNIITEKNTVTVKDICTVVSNMTGIPMDQLDIEETKRLMNMEKELHRTVIGQNDAIACISSAVRRARAGVSSFKRPQGSFIFLGPTGVGKTLLAKTLTKFLFGTEDSLIRIDMSDFMEKHNASRLIGAPPGYIGYEEGGVLTEKVRRNPYSVVLLDEIEKAHPDIFNLLLQVLEEGELRDNLGHTVNFRNTVIIMTSNAGARQISGENRLGFSTTGDGIIPYDDIKTGALAELKRIMSPELLNRVDDIVVFNALSKVEVSEILNNQIADFQERIKEKGLTIELKPAAREYLISNGYEPALGARPMRRLIQREIEDAAALEILSGKCSAGDTIVVNYKNDSIILKINSTKKKEHK